VSDENPVGLLSSHLGQNQFEALECIDVILMALYPTGLHFIDGGVRDARLHHVTRANATARPKTTDSQRTPGYGLFDLMADARQLGKC